MAKHMFCASQHAAAITVSTQEQVMDKMWFKKLTPQQVIEFRAAARSQYKVFTSIDGTWHPSYQHECVLMNYEAAVFIDERPVAL